MLRSRTAAMFRCTLGIALATAALPLAAAPQTYALDPVHTRVMFAVSHAGFSKALGTVSGSTGTLRFDPADWSAATLEVTVPLTRLDLGDAKWTAAAGATNLLNLHRYPQAHFVATTTTGVDANHGRVGGDPPLPRLPPPVCPHVTLNALKRHPMPPFRRTAGFSATATLKRGDFGIDAWPKVIGEDVELRIEAEAVRSNAADDTDHDETGTPP